MFQEAIIEQAFITCYFYYSHFLLKCKEETNIADGALLRGLDKASEVVDFGLKSGDTYSLWKLSITLSECRYPVSNPVGDALLTSKFLKKI